MKTHRLLHTKTMRVSIYSMFTTVLLLSVFFMFFCLLLARDRQFISLMVFGDDGYDDMGERMEQAGDGVEGTEISSSEEGSESASFEKQKPKKIIIIAYPRKLSESC